MWLFRKCAMWCLSVHLPKSVWTDIQGLVSGVCSYYWFRNCLWKDLQCKQWPELCTRQQEEFVLINQHTHTYMINTHAWTCCASSGLTEMLWGVWPIYDYINLHMICNNQHVNKHGSGRGGVLEGILEVWYVYCKGNYIHYMSKYLHILMVTPHYKINNLLMDLEFVLILLTNEHTDVVSELMIQEQ